MKLKKFKDQEEIINDLLSGKKIIKGYEFEEIDFEAKDVVFTVEMIDPEYGWYDLEQRYFGFKDLKENHNEIYKRLVKKIKKCLATQN
jgi:hypothetical protein